jgi:hypothetical protein
VVAALLEPNRTEPKGEGTGAVRTGRFVGPRVSDMLGVAARVGEVGPSDQ